MSHKSYVMTSLLNYLYSGRKINDEQPCDFEDQLATSTTRTTQNEKVVLEVFDEYCAHSTIHGVRYFSETRRHWIERCWWIFAFLMSVFCCGALIYKIYNKLNINSVYISFADEPTPVWQIPFPAITICPTTKINFSQLNLTDGIDKVLKQNRRPSDVSDEGFSILKAVSQICEPYIGEVFGSLELGDNFTDNSIVELLMKTAPRLNDTVFECHFLNNEKYLCVFEELMTEEGLCFTFNMLNGHETYTNDMSPDYAHQSQHNRMSNWNLERGYDTNIRFDSYPYRVAGSGADGDKLRAWLELSAMNLEYLCRGPIQGYTIVLHVPGEIPQVSKHFFLIPQLQEVSVAVKANIMKTPEDLRHYHHDRRKCYFESERKLRFLKVYTQRNCELECLSNATLDTCGCVKFSYPRHATTPICGSEKIRCYHYVRDNLLKSDLAASKVSRPCNCLPACNSITYDAEISQNPFDWSSYSKAVNESTEYLPTRFQIFFKENEFIALTRSVLFDTTDFVASCGGLLGLFMGASFLSIIELLYFCSLRLCCKIRARVIRKRDADHPLAKTV